MGHRPNVAGRFFAALGNVGVNVHAIAQGATQPQHLLRRGRRGHGARGAHRARGLQPRPHGGERPAAGQGHRGRTPAGASWRRTPCSCASATASRLRLVGLADRERAAFDARRASRVRSRSWPRRLAAWTGRRRCWSSSPACRCRCWWTAPRRTGMERLYAAAFARGASTWWRRTRSRSRCPPRGAGAARRRARALPRLPLRDDGGREPAGHRDAEEPGAHRGPRRAHRGQLLRDAGLPLPRADGGHAAVARRCAPRASSATPSRTRAMTSAAWTWRARRSSSRASWAARWSSRTWRWSRSCRARCWPRRTPSASSRALGDARRAGGRAGGALPRRRAGACATSRSWSVRRRRQRPRLRVGPVAVDAEHPAMRPARRGGAGGLLHRALPRLPPHRPGRGRGRRRHGRRRARRHPAARGERARKTLS